MKPFITMLLMVVCISGVAYAETDQGTKVKFGFNDTQNLITHFNAQGYDAEHGDECCYPEDDAQAIWIGRKVPIDDVKYIVAQAIQAYPWLVYYSHFGEELSGYPDALDHVVYIGGSKRAAMCQVAPVEVEVALQVLDQINTRDQLEYFLAYIQREKTDTRSNMKSSTTCQRG